MAEALLHISLPEELRALLSACPSWEVPSDRDAILRLATGDEPAEEFDVSYDVPGLGAVVEATVVRCKNGLSVNYPDPRMRRRDPDCLVVADDQPSDKDRFDDRFGEPFDGLRQATLAWLQQQELLVLPLYTGGRELGYATLLVAPRNAAFFVGALADLQEMACPDLSPDFGRRRHLAPLFRRTHLAPAGGHHHRARSPRIFA
jgi:hypothetical protein